MFNDRHAYILSKSFQTIKIPFKPIQTQNIINFLLDFFYLTKPTNIPNWFVISMKWFVMGTQNCVSFGLNNPKRNIKHGSTRIRYICQSKRRPYNAF